MSIFGPVCNGNGDRFRAAPPAFCKTSCTDEDILERYILHIAFIPDLNGNAAVGIGDNAILDQNVFKVSGSLSSDLYSCGS